jgi:hypothetical protein
VPFLTSPPPPQGRLSPPWPAFTCPCYPAHTSCPCWPVLVVLSLLSCPCCHVLAALSLPSYPCCPILSVFPFCPVLSVLFLLSCPCCPVLAVLSLPPCPFCLSFQLCPVVIVMLRFCPGFHNRPFLTECEIISYLYHIVAGCFLSYVSYTITTVCTMQYYF